MGIVLQPKQAAAVKDKAKEIRETWDGMTTITMEIRKQQIFNRWGVERVAAKTGERIFIPVPCRGVEERSRGSGPVIEYTLSPEELEKYRGGTEDMAKGVKVEIKMTKEQYLKERLVGNTRTQIMNGIGASTTVFYRKLKEWGIKEADAEDRELELLAPAKPKTEPPAEEKSPPGRTGIG